LPGSLVNENSGTFELRFIRYGPCAFIEAYDPRAVFSSIDENGRYAFGNQPAIARWNLARCAETLLPLIDDTSPEKAVEQATEVINGFPACYEAKWLAGARVKLGLATAAEEDARLAKQWLALPEEQRVDFTLAWRRLADAAAGEVQPLTALFKDMAALDAWLVRWRERCVEENTDAGVRAEAMRHVSPIYIPRNHRVEEALTAASNRSDFTPLERLVDAVTHPFEERPGLEDYALPAPPEVTACYKTLCGT
jgi:serine/tyrosine/threonine adenylyltransferase